MLTILGKSESINVRKVLWTCAELGLQPGRDYRHDANWGGKGRSTKEDEFLALNPHGLVPVLRDGPTTLWESNSILRYLVAKHGRTDLLPATPAARAKVEMWMDWQLGDLNGAWRGAFMGLVRNHPDFQNKAAIIRSTQAWNAMMLVLDRHLQTTNAYVTGAEFTAADIVLGLAVNRWAMTPIERPQLDAVTAYYDRLTEREGFRRFGRNGQP
jgi:glutathione S-transferase